MRRRGNRLAVLCLAGGLVMAQLTGCSSSGQTQTDVESGEAAGNASGTAGEASEGAETSGVAGEAESAAGAQEVRAVLGENQEMSVTYEAEDLDASWSEGDATMISLKDGDSENGDATIEGAGASWQDGVLTISKAGTYVLSGKVQDGRIVVDAGKDDVVRLVLNGLDIHSTVTSAIYGAQSGKIIVILADGTENVVSDPETYSWESEEGEPNAAIFSKDDLVINGTGSLNVTGNYECGIRSKDDLTIVSGDISVTAKTDGLKGKDSVKIKDGTIDIKSEDDAIQSNNDTDADKGYIWIDGGVITIDAVGKAITAETRAVINGGEITVAACKEGVEGSTVDINGGTLNIVASDDALNAGITVETEREKMMDQEGVYIRIAGGVLRLNASGDGIDSNGDLYMEGGEVYLCGPEGDGEGVLDYNGNASVTGGTFFGAGSAGMAQTFGEDSTQNSLVVYYTEKQAAETEIRLLDADGNLLGSYTPEKAFAMAIISTPEITLGNTYTVQTGDQNVELEVEGVLTIYGTASGRGMGGRGEGGMNGGMGGRGEGRPDGGMGDGAMTPPDGGAGDSAMTPPDGGAGDGAMTPPGGGTGERPERPGGGMRAEDKSRAN